MTTGSRLDDSRTLVGLPSQTSCYSPPVFDPGLVGSYYSRTWSGANAPKRTKPANLSDGFTYLVPKYRSQGGKSSIIGYEERHRFYKRPTNDPRSVLGEHDYSMTSVRSTSDIYTRRFPCEAGTLNHPFRTETYSSDGFVRSSATQRWTPNDDIALYGALREAIQGDDFNLGVTLGEGRESLQTIADGATRIAKSLRALKKGRATQAWNHLVVGRPKTGSVTYYKDGKPLPRIPRVKDIPVKEVTRDWVAGSWLQFQYGWRPLIQDVHSAARHLAHMLNSPRNKTYRVTKRVKAIDMQPYISIYYPSTFESYTRKSIVARVRTVDEVGLLGLKDPASVAWELVPYSFVVDWFIPIGNYLSAKELSRRIAGTFIISTKVYTKRVGLRQTDQIRGGEGTSCEYVTLNRTIHSSLPSVNLPTVTSYDKIATWTHAASAISLILATFLK